jgi:hypothetical protein
LLWRKNLVCGKKNLICGEKAWSAEKNLVCGKKKLGLRRKSLVCGKKTWSAEKKLGLRRNKLDLRRKSLACGEKELLAAKSKIKAVPDESVHARARGGIYIVDLYGLLCFDPVSQVSTILDRLLFTGWHLSGYIE